MGWDDIFQMDVRLVFEIVEDLDTYIVARQRLATEISIEAFYGSALLDIELNTSFFSLEGMLLMGNDSFNPSFPKELRVGEHYIKNPSGQIAEEVVMTSNYRAVEYSDFNYCEPGVGYLSPYSEAGSRFLERIITYKRSDLPLDYPDGHYPLPDDNRQVSQSDGNYATSAGQVGYSLVLFRRTLSKSTWKYLFESHLLAVQFLAFAGNPVDVDFTPLYSQQGRDPGYKLYDEYLYGDIPWWSYPGENCFSHPLWAGYCGYYDVETRGSYTHWSYINFPSSWPDVDGGAFRRTFIRMGGGGTPKSGKVGELFALGKQAFPLLSRMLACHTGVDVSNDIAIGGEAVSVGDEGLTL